MFCWLGLATEIRIGYDVDLILKLFFFYFFSFPGAGLGAVAENDADEEDQSPSPEVIPSSPQLDHQSTNIWATQLSIFFDKFFGTADRLEMIKKVAQKSKGKH